MKGAEEVLSSEIANPDCPELLPYSRANRAFIRARLRKWDKALEDTQMVICTSSSMMGRLIRLPMESNDAQVPLIAHIAKGFALSGQGNHQEATEAFELALRTCDGRVRSFFKLVKVR